MDLKPVLSDGNALSVMRATVYTCSFIEMQRASFVTFFFGNSAFGIYRSSSRREEGSKTMLLLFHLLLYH